MKIKKFNEELGGNSTPSSEDLSIEISKEDKKLYGSLFNTIRTGIQMHKSYDEIYRELKKQGYKISKD